MTFLDAIRKNLGKLRHTLHAIQKEYSEGITADQIEKTLKAGFELIEEYPDDPRGASGLILCWIEDSPLHIVCAPHEDVIIIISKYEPTMDKWMDDYKTRR